MCQIPSDLYYMIMVRAITAQALKKPRATIITCKTGTHFWKHKARYGEYSS